MAALLPWDALFLAGFAASGYRTVGRWLKYTDDTAKAQSDGAYMEGFKEFLAEAAAAGERAKPSPGAGADASGQGHLWRDWNGLKTKQRIALLGEMQKVLEWTGQDEAFRLVKKHRGQPWSALPHAAKKALLAAADKMDWSFLAEMEELCAAAKKALLAAAYKMDWSFLAEMEEEGAEIAHAAHLWQVNEPVPALSAEPALAAALLDESEGLKGMVDSADLAVNALLTGQQEAVIAGLAPAEKLQEAVIAGLAPAEKLQVGESRRKVDVLREAAQGGLGLGSGGKAARGQQLLELLRGIALVPASSADQEAKAAAVAALDAAADEAVAPLKEQHTTAAAAAAAAARSQALAATLGGQIRFAPGKPALSAAAAAAVIAVACDESAAAMAALSSAAGLAGGLAAKRAAAEQLMGLGSITESTAAALAAVMGENEAAGEVLGQLSESAEKLQEASIKFAELKLKAEAAAAKQQPADDAAADAEANAAAADADSAAASAVEEALTAVKAAAEQLPGLQESPAAAEEEQEGVEGPAAVTVDSVKEALLAEVEERVAVVEERTKQQQEAALQNARSRERMSALLTKAKKLQQPAAVAAAGAPEAPAEGSTDDSAEQQQQQPEEPAMSAAERLAVAEEFLKQLGARPLAAALGDLNKLMEAQAGPDSMPQAAAASLAAGIALEEASNASLSKLGQLLSEIQLADAVIGLEMGPGVMPALDKLSAYMAAKQAEAAAAGEEGSDDVASTPKGAIDKCMEQVEALRRDGLVVLGLSSAQYRQLGMLREATANLSTSLDALRYDRCVSALKDVAGQLGPIGAAIQTKLAATEDEALRQLMSEQKALAVDLFGKLQAFLSFEESIRGPLKKSLRELNSLAGGIGAPRTPSGCAAAALKLDMAAEEAQKLQDLLAELAASKGEAAEDTAAAPAPDSVAATQKIVDTLQGTVEALQASLSSLSAHVALRARALDPAVAAAAAAAGLEGADLDLNTLDNMEPELDHPLYILGATEEELQAEWEAKGFEQVARGRVATILIATATADGAHTHPADAAKAGSAAGGGSSSGSDSGSVPRVAVAVPGLPSGKSVLQLTAERILRLQQLAAAATFGQNAPVSRHVQWYIMTSPATHDKLAATLKEQAFFGLSQQQVTLFCCKAAPPAFAGEPLRALQLGPSTLTRGTPGSGEVFAELKRSGVLRGMRGRGIRQVEVNAVDDNVLARPADPLLIGFAMDKGLDAAAKVVEPSSVSAAYAAAMPAAAAADNDAQNPELQPGEALNESISFLAPAIGSYYFSFTALDRLASFYDANPLAMYRMAPVGKLPSKAPPPAMTVNLPPNATQAQRMQAQQALMAAQQAAAAAPPKPVDGYVPTRFISDVFCTAAPATPSAAAAAAAAGLSPLSGCSLAYLGVDREEEFSCVMGGGPHLAVPEPELAAGDLLALTTSWVENSGAVVECEEGVEVSPLVSYAGEGLDAVAGEGVTFAEPYDLTLQGATGQGKPKHNAGPWVAPVLVAYAVGAGLAVAKQLTGNK
uniref:UDP-N-acetylglucosamine diphosphorylase n=1 Tax=Tetradesmus obliquus TaxID=3088 RepID=A0A383W4Q6_TETOB